MAQFAEGDKEILRLLAEFVNLRARDVAELTKRNLFAIYRRLRVLYGLGYINFLFEDSDKLRDRKLMATSLRNQLERVHFLTQKGWDRALELGFIQLPVHANEEKKNTQLNHDLKLTDIHVSLWRRYGEKLHWYQYRPYIYTRWGDDKNDFVKPDAFFWLDLSDRFPAFFVELENNRETMHEADGDLVAKMRRFTNFAKGHFQATDPFQDFADFRVAIYRLSPTLAKNMAAKAKRVDDSLATRRFWLTDIPSAIRGEERFVTPRDYEQTSYSFEAA